MSRRMPMGWIEDFSLQIHRATAAIGVSTILAVTRILSLWGQSSLLVSHFPTPNAIVAENLEFDTNGDDIDRVSTVW